MADVSDQVFGYVASADNGRADGGSRAIPHPRTGVPTGATVGAPARRVPAKRAAGVR